jgi:hypothetical protein
MGGMKVKRNLINDREWHFEYWKSDYEKMPYEYARSFMEAEKLLSKLNELNKKSIQWEAARREHAISMGVTILESDKVFSMQEIIQGTENLVKIIKENYKAIGIKIDGD